jgi:hypothetical protein
VAEKGKQTAVCTRRSSTLSFLSIQPQVFNNTQPDHQCIITRGMEEAQLIAHLNTLASASALHSGNTAVQPI